MTKSRKDEETGTDLDTSSNVQPASLFQPLAECIDCERLLTKWWDTEVGSLPTDDELERIDRHRLTCITGAHRNESEPASSYAMVSRGRAAGVGIAPFLEQVGAVERGYDYVLPNGLHCDVHVNVEQLCHSDVYLDLVATIVANRLSQCEFDTIVSTSWSLRQIVRRALRILNANGIEHLTVEGYGARDIEISQAPRPGAKAVLLLDVMVTGGLVHMLTGAIRTYDATVTTGICLVDSMFPRHTLPVSIHSLSAIPMDIRPAAACERHTALPLRHWNPVSGQMTAKKRDPRSPTDFLRQDPTAREMWDSIDRAGVYQKHRILDGRHYIAFVDTLGWLRDPTTGPPLISELSQKIRIRSRCPEVLLVPDRARGRFLANRLAQQLADAEDDEPEIVVVPRYGKTYSLGTDAHVRGRRVLIVDAAAGRGDTIDELALLASARGAASIGAAVLLSRLSEGYERALNARLDDGFVSLYSLPVRPSERSCHVCERRRQLQTLATLFPAGPIRDLANTLGRPPQWHPVDSRAHQLALFERPPWSVERPFCALCRGIVSGIALHSAHAALGDGMAPLSLPELLDPDVPMTNRVALLEDLPRGTISHSGIALQSELLAILRAAPDRHLWMAIANLFVREGLPDWIDCLVDTLRSQPPWVDARFWRRLAVTAHELVGQGEDSREQATARLRGVASKLMDSEALNEVQALLRDIEAAPGRPQIPTV